MKKVLIPLLLILLLVPTVNAQPEGFQVIPLGHEITKKGILTLTVEVSGAYEIQAEISLNYILHHWAKTSFPTNGTNIWEFDIPFNSYGEHYVEANFFGWTPYQLVPLEVSIAFTFIDYPPPEIHTIPDTPTEREEENTLLLFEKNAYVYGLSLGLAFFIGILWLTSRPQKRRHVPSFVSATPKNTSAKDTIKVDTSTYHIFDLPDDKDWRSCPFCEEWNDSQTKRCTHCDGRLGKPLRRDSS